MLRSLRRRTAPARVFDARLIVHQLESLPMTNIVVHVRWEVTQSGLASPPSGCTQPRPVQPGNFVRWDQTFFFNVRLMSEPHDSSLLQPCVLRLSVRSDRRKKSDNDHLGVVEIDLAEVAGVGKLSRSCLVHKSLLNSLLKISLKMQLREGDSIFRSPSGKYQGQQQDSVQASAAPKNKLPFATLNINGHLLSNTLLATNFGRNAVDGSASQLPTPADHFQSGPLRRTESTSAVCLQSTDDSHRQEVLRSWNSFQIGQDAPQYSSSDRSNDDEHRRSLDSHSQNYATRRASRNASGAGDKTSDVPALPKLNFAKDKSRTRGRSRVLDRKPSRFRSLPASEDNDSQFLTSPISPTPLPCASTVLDYFVPECDQEDVYESMRLARVRDTVPAHIVASRVSAEDVISDLFLQCAIQRHTDQARDLQLSQAGPREVSALELNLEGLIETSGLSNAPVNLASRRKHVIHDSNITASRGEPSDTFNTPSLRSHVANP